MGIDLYAERGTGKGKIELCFGRSYHFKGYDNCQRIDEMDFEREMEDSIKEQERFVEKVKGYAKYSPTSIEDADAVTEDVEGVLECLSDEAQRYGSLLVFQELKDAGFKFVEE